MARIITEVSNYRFKYAVRIDCGRKSGARTNAKGLNTENTVEFWTTKVGPLAVVLILGLAALFVIKGLFKLTGAVLQKMTPSAPKRLKLSFRRLKKSLRSLLKAKFFLTLKLTLILSWSESEWSLTTRFWLIRLRRQDYSHHTLRITNYGTRF